MADCKPAKVGAVPTLVSMITGEWLRQIGTVAGLKILDLKYENIGCYKYSIQIKRVLTMNYSLIYDKIIEKRRKIVPLGYTENHHIIPVSFGGSNNKENLIRLTAREHFLCHWLLIKINPNGELHHKAIHAFMMMASISKTTSGRITSRIFENYKKEFSLVMSINQTGEKNSQYGKTWYNNPNLKESRIFYSSESIPIGWEIGRVVKWDKTEELKLKKIEKEKIKKKNKTERDRIYKIKWESNRIFALEILNFISENKIESVAKLMRMGHYSEFEYSDKLVGFLKRHAKEEFHSLIKPKFGGKTTNRKTRE